ncbi:MAG: hypothetical protein AAF500_03995 [Myxococcota bacterium]
MALWILVLVVSMVGCGSDDGGSTTAALCEATCARAIDCVEETIETVDSCTEQCIAEVGAVVCDAVNQPNLDACLSQIGGLSCEALAAAQVPPICGMVCLVRVQSFDPSVALKAVQ